MNTDTLADLLRSRGCGVVHYFHTDHFEPWSNNIDDVSAKAVDRMRTLAKASPYGRRLSLFYSVFVPYRLAADGSDAQTCVAGDRVAFADRTARQEALARDAIRPLVTADDHELHLHVHHEYWTRNHSHFANPVSQWVNAHSTGEADRQRLDLHFRLCKEAIAREIGTAFGRWAFVHGNWALNASDPLICQITDEIAIIMNNGGFADFSFPAGRSYCDPKLKTPFTCLPIDAVRAYDDARADARSIGPNTQVMAPDRFLIWNAPIRSVDCSLDYYSAANRDLFKTPERVVSTWLSKSVCLEGGLFIKTHAHSMKSDYRLWEADGVIPHCYPSVVAAFDCLARACDRAKVELRLQTVNEVVSRLAQIDGSAASHLELHPVPQIQAPVMPSIDSVAADYISVPAPDSLDLSINDVVVDLVDLHRSWLAAEGARLPKDDLYLSKLAHGTPLESYELALASAIAERYPVNTVRILEVGTGWGGLCIALARMGFEVFGYEGNVARRTACQWHFDRQIECHPELRQRLHLLREGLFPLAFAQADLAPDRINLCVITNITSTYSENNQEAILRTAAECDEIILDLGRFGQVRDGQQERDALLEVMTNSHFKPIERIYQDNPYEYWRLRSSGLAGRQRSRTEHPVRQRPAVAATPPLPTPPQKQDRAGRLYSTFGDKVLQQCPVCNSSQTAPLWRMPMTNLDKPIEVFGGYFNQIPTLQVPTTMFCFDFCADCETIFLNPTSGGQKEAYRRSQHYINKMQDAAEWKDYEDVYDNVLRWIPSDAAVLVDAACGIGQYLQIARKRGGHNWRRLLGLELSEKYVEYMRGEGIEAHVFDIDNDDLSPLLPPDSADFIIFSEAFEHVDRPIDALGKLLTALRPKGRLYFTAQRYGVDTRAAVRPGEPIYISEPVIKAIPQRLPCRIINKTTSATRYYVVVEKVTAPRAGIS